MKWLFSLLLLFVVTFATINTFESDVANETELVMNDFDIGIMNANSNFQKTDFVDVESLRPNEIQLKTKSNTLKNLRQISNPFRKARDGFLCS
jgi:hypothetical protein